MAPRSISGAGGRPLLRRFPLAEVIESIDAADPFCCFNLAREPLGRPSDDGRGERESLWRCVEGRTNFFCLLAGRISSRSTGTPRDTRNRRRMRERTQFGGCKGGGATSCDQSERLRSVRKTDVLSEMFFAGWGSKLSCDVRGKRSSRYISVAESRSSSVSNLL